MRVMIERFRRRGRVDLTCPRDGCGERIENVQPPVNVGETVEVRCEFCETSFTIEKRTSRDLGATTTGLWYG